VGSSGTRTGLLKQIINQGYETLYDRVCKCDHKNFTTTEIVSNV
jgi:hypothetical protein